MRFCYSFGFCENQSEEYQVQLENCRLYVLKSGSTLEVISRHVVSRIICNEVAKQAMSPGR